MLEGTKKGTRNQSWFIFRSEEIMESDSFDPIRDDDFITVVPQSRRRVYLPIKRSIVKIRGKGKFMENRFLSKTPCSNCSAPRTVLISCANEGCHWLSCLDCLGPIPEVTVCGSCETEMNREIVN